MISGQVIAATIAIFVTLVKEKIDTVAILENMDLFNFVSITYYLLVIN